jgi:predicted small secreted protein
MKNIFIKISALILVLFILTSCGNTNTGNTTDIPVKPFEYAVLETSLSSDSSALIKHKADINLGLSNKTDISKKDFIKEITLDSIKINGKYSNTSVSPYYNRTVDVYKKTNGSVQTEFKIIPETNRLVGYSVYDHEYATKSERKNEIIEEEAINIATDYLKNHISDTENYRVTTRYSEIEIFKGWYAVYFTRYIGNIPTQDSAYIYVTAYGDIVRFDFNNLGDMKDLTVLSEHNLEDIDKAVDEKRDEIYADVIGNSEYKVSFSRGKKLIRLSDGKYALEYTINADILRISTDIHSGDISSFIVLLE